MIRGEIIGFVLFPRAQVFSFEEPFFFSMQENVAALVKESEPEVVIRFVSGAELNHGLILRDPPRSAADMGMPQLGREDHGNAALSAIFLNGGLDAFQI